MSRVVGWCKCGRLLKNKQTFPSHEHNKFPPKYITNSTPFQVDIVYPNLTVFHVNRLCMTFIKNVCHLRHEQKQKFNPPSCSKNNHMPPSLVQKHQAPNYQDPTPVLNGCSLTNTCDIIKSSNVCLVII